MRQVPIGGVVDSREVGNPMYLLGQYYLTEQDPFINMGFQSIANQPNLWRRAVAMDQAVGSLATDSPGLVLSNMASLPNIDCLAVSSIGRGAEAKIYLYDTLRSIFSTFPSEVQVNVLVGNDQTAYVSHEQLIQQLWPEAAGQVHVWPTPPEVATQAR